MSKKLSFARLLFGAFAIAAMVAVFAMPASASTSTSTSASPRFSAFAVNARDISGAPTGSVNLVGIGVSDSANGFFRAGGAFRCTTTVNQGPLTGCLAGQGTRWDSSTQLASTGFKCVGGTEALKMATTGEGTSVFTANFFRVGGAPLTANVIVSKHDIAPDIAGVQNVWIQNVGCATASVGFIG